MAVVIDAKEALLGALLLLSSIAIAVVVVVVVEVRVRALSLLQPLVRHSLARSRTRAVTSSRSLSLPWLPFNALQPTGWRGGGGAKYVDGAATRGRLLPCCGVAVLCVLLAPQPSSSTFRKTFSSTCTHTHTAQVNNK